MKAARTKYNERNPKIAKIFEVKTINGSVVMAKIAGILSNANIMSVVSTTIKAINRGVATQSFPSLIKK